jgi:hypothetical protein
MHPLFTANIAEERAARRRHEAESERLIHAGRRKAQPKRLSKRRLPASDSVVTLIFHRILRVP